ncbi:helix-turn-helix domain-containing protein [Dysgonomonas sp. HGC4]|uniref:helix-turn-helix domain-containing protein n=1 Tax=Dysgonomonas sp. HGC4 TaxID=1658009 RepID=UPI0006829C01|nr:AraC family transcriptional regulator [Dysgonomonas sp. HGC4]MBD8347751.1 helix-turn-helix transcriptional regulator [Dysgonomonas sp. HGC4]
MKILHLNEHVACRTCLNCDKGANPSIKMEEVGKGVLLGEQAIQNIIIFLLEGEITYSFGMYTDCKMRRGQVLYLPVDYKLSYKVESEARLLFIRLDCKLQFCDCYRLEDLVHWTLEMQAPLDTKTDSPYLLEMNGALKAYADMLLYCIGQGLCCRYYNEVKINELLYLFGEFYPKEELGLFFREALSHDTSFSHYVMNNYYKYHSLSELAIAMDMSLSGLEKRFRKVFNTSGYKWMNDHKTKKIYHALCMGEKSLNELCTEFGFASKSSFNRYCKQHLGQTPGVIRLNIGLSVR